MTDEDKKKITSEPPPPTDEIDDEWGAAGDAPEAVSPGKPAAPAAKVGETAVAPTSAPARSDPAAASAPAGASAEAREDEDEDEEAEDEEAEDEDEDEDEDEEAEDEDDASAQPAPTQPSAGRDFIPDWAPYLVLGLLVAISIIVGLGIVGGPDAAAQEESPAVPSAKPTSSALKKAPARPGSHQ